MPVFNRVSVVLVETSRAGNIGAAARALKNMGFYELVLVNPRVEDAANHEEAIAFASGAQDVLTSARTVGSIDEALADCNYAAAVSARLREFSPPVIAPRGFAARLVAEPALHAALVFGNERFGLPNEIVEKCNVLINIPANPDYSSLNLAQAVQVLTYEMHAAAVGKGHCATTVGFKGDAASLAQIEGMYEHFEHALSEIGFLDTNNPKKLMPRLKRLFARTRLEIEEVNILRGIAKQILAKNEGRNKS